MPARKAAIKATETNPETTEAASAEAMADNIITVNVAVAIKIDPAKWSLAEQSTEDLLTVKIQAEKGLDEDAARKLAVLMIENGLADMITKSSGTGGVNDVRREIREHVLAQVAAFKAFADAGATVELNEARRTNHAVK